MFPAQLITLNNRRRFDTCDSLHLVSKTGLVEFIGVQRQTEASRILVCSGCMLEHIYVMHTLNVCPQATNSQEMTLLLMPKEKTVNGTQTISGREGGEGIAREQVTAFSGQSSIVMSLTSTFPPDICHCFSSVHASHYQNKYSKLSGA